MKIHDKVKTIKYRKETKKREKKMRRGKKLILHKKMNCPPLAEKYSIAICLCLGFLCFLCSFSIWPPTLLYIYFIPYLLSSLVFFFIQTLPSISFVYLFIFSLNSLRYNTKPVWPYNRFVSLFLFFFFCFLFPLIIFWHTSKLQMPIAKTLDMNKRWKMGRFKGWRN